MSVLIKPQGFILNEFLDWMDEKYESRAKTKLWKKALVGLNTKTMRDGREAIQKLFMEKYEQMLIDCGRDFTETLWPLSLARINQMRYLEKNADRAADRDKRLRNLYHGEDYDLDRRFKNDWMILKEIDIETKEIIFEMPLNLGEALTVDESTKLINSNSLTNLMLNPNLTPETAEYIHCLENFEKEVNKDDNESDE